jgi:uncharacterized RDD family membrane protein YckC
VVSQTAPKPSWKQEVNQRLEAHKSRKGLSGVEDVSQREERSNVSDRAAQAAARVAARFSNAPSYGEMQAAEARAALRNAEAATRAALEAQAAAQAALANLERLSERLSERLIEAEEEQNAPDSLPHDRADWGPEAELPSISAPPPKAEWATERLAAAVAPKQTPFLTNPIKHSTESVRLSPAYLTEEPAEDAPDKWVEPAKPIHANLIRFPRELVATRRIRPHLAENLRSEAEEQNGQLNIFEVEPKSISTEPAASVAAGAAMSAPSWSGSDWPSADFEREFDGDRESVAELTSLAPAIHLAPFSLRAIAATVDFALVIAMASAATLGIAGHTPHGLSMKTVEIGAVVSFLLIAVFYQTFFLLTAMSTPGMMYAGISLCTLDDEFPTRKQLRDRIGAMLISFLPMGLGMAWPIFDEDRLSWHDRLSRTYQRRC